ncbi:MAG: NAD(P)-dependent alcohol dehydrogenase [Eggerthellaceae bacterium]|nr:NAD(P)-dependent alcohol dehydrogenase [Eggerthellaceae bacterium]
MDIKAAVVNEFGAPLSIETIQLADPKPDEILVKMVASGICHTDEAGRMGVIPFMSRMNYVLGHEGAGIVEAVGSNVTEFVPGDHVAISYPFCGECKPCKDNKPYACELSKKLSFGGYMPDGTTRLTRETADGVQEIGMFFAQASFASHVVVEAKSAAKIDPDFDLTLAGPLGCGLQTGAGIVLNCLKLTPGQSFVVFGCGAVGMAAIMAAKICGCNPIIAVDIKDKSLELAPELGATHVIDSRNVDDLVAAVREIVPTGVDAALDTSGVEFLIRAALGSCNYLGKVVVAGACKLELNLTTDLGAKSLIGVSEGYSVPKEFIPQLIEYHKQGLFPIEKIITTFPFENVNEALEALHRPDVIKAVLVM